MTKPKNPGGGFSHPLARDASIWPATTRDGATPRFLVVVTTLALDSESKKFKPEMVGRLRAAAQQWLDEDTARADGFVLVNRVRDWHGRD